MYPEKILVQLRIRTGAFVLQADQIGGAVIIVGSSSLLSHEPPMANTLL